MCMFHFFESRFLPPITQKEPNTRRRLHPYATVNARGGKNTRSTFSQVTWKKSAQSTTSCLPAQKKIISPFKVLRSRKAETPKKRDTKPLATSCATARNAADLSHIQILELAIVRSQAPCVWRKLQLPEVVENSVASCCALPACNFLRIGLMVSDAS